MDFPLSELLLKLRVWIGLSSSAADAIEVFSEAYLDLLHWEKYDEGGTSRSPEGTLDELGYLSSFPSSLGLPRE